MKDFKITAVLCWMWVALSLTNVARFVNEVADHGGKVNGWSYLYAATAALSITCAAHHIGKLNRRGK